MIVDLNDFILFVTIEDKVSLAYKFLILVFEYQIEFVCVVSFDVYEVDCGRRFKFDGEDEEVLDLSLIHI